MQRLLTVLTALAVAVSLAAAMPALAAVSGRQTKTIVRATLPNGLRVVIVQNRLAPVVATSVNYLVGSDETPTGFPGTAHAQEHMMFRGTPGLSADQLADIGAIMGGNFNANTRESLTQYLYTVPAEDVDVALHIEALRMAGVDDTEEGWSKERGAIEQEVAADVSNPEYKLYEQLRAQMFSGSIYEHDALGTKTSFDKTTVAALKAFHDTWYAPNNAILVIVGDVDPAAVLAKVKSNFGDIPSKSLPLKPSLNLPPLTGGHIDLPTDRPSTTQLLVLRLPGMDSPDFPALELLTDALGSQRFELYNLVAQGKAISAQFAFDPLPKAGLGYAEVAFDGAENAHDIEKRIRIILQNVRDHGISPDLIRAAKLQEHRQTEFQKNSIAGLASVWSDALALYGLPSPDADLARLDKVTVDDVNRVAKKYLDLDHAVSATLAPQRSGGPAVSNATFGGQETIALGEASGAALPQWASALTTGLKASHSNLRPSVEKLANGLTLIVQPTDVSDTVSIYGHIRNRPEVQEPAGKDGVSLVLDQLLRFGTTNHERVKFQEALDAIGAEEQPGTDFSIKALRRNFAPAAALLAENELSPALPGEALQKLKGQFTPFIAARNKSPGYLAQYALRVGLYPARDPLRRQADAVSLGSLTRADIVSYYKDAFRPDLATIVVIGNVSVAEAHAVIARTFGGWSATGAMPVVDPDAVRPNAASAVSVPDASRVQDNVVLAQTLAMPRSNPDFYALELGNAVLGGGFYASRLSIDLRKNGGLVYSVNSGLQPSRTRSAFLVRYASNPDNVIKAQAAVEKEMSDLQSVLIPLAELEKAKALLLRQIPLSEAGVDDIAQEWLRDQDLGLSLDESRIAGSHYLTLSPQDVQGAFRKWMRPNELVRVSQGPTP